LFGGSDCLLYDFARQFQSLRQTGESRFALAVYKISVTESIDTPCPLRGVPIAESKPKRLGIDPKLLYPSLNQSS
jgi:hypothetical protein